MNELSPAEKRLAQRLFEEFRVAYAAGTTRNPGLLRPSEWWHASLKHPQITPAIAAGWDRCGWTPEAALPLIERGITPTRALLAGRAVDRPE